MSCGTKYTYCHCMQDKIAKYCHKYPKPSPVTSVQIVNWITLLRPHLPRSHEPTSRFYSIIMPSTGKSTTSKLAHNGSFKSNSSSSAPINKTKFSEATDRFLAEKRDYKSLAVAEYDSHQASDRRKHAENLLEVLSNRYWGLKKRCGVKNVVLGLEMWQYSWHVIVCFGWTIFVWVQCSEE